MSERADRTDWCMECGAATQKADDGKSAVCPKCGAEYEKVVGSIWGKKRREPTETQKAYEDFIEARNELGRALMETRPLKAIHRLLAWLGKKLP